jgi:hypothetical protein
MSLLHMGAMPVSPDEVEVLRVRGGATAESIVAALRGNGIPARARGEAVGTLFGLTLDGLGEVSILVPEEYAEQARTVLSAGELGMLKLGDSDTTEEPEPEGR